MELRRKRDEEMGADAVARANSVSAQQQPAM